MLNIENWFIGAQVIVQLVEIVSALCKYSSELWCTGKLCILIGIVMPFSRKSTKMAFWAMLEIWRRAEWV